MKRVELDGARVRALAGTVQNARVCMIGDVCLDLYWRADMRLSRLSRETPHFPLPVVGETASPGGGGNVACNLRALGVGELTVISVIGDDWRGFLLRDCFAKRGIDTGRLIVSQGRVTPCYCKPLRAGISETVYEDPRIDFENFDPISAGDEDRVLAALDEAAGRCDVIAVCDQYRHGVLTGRVRARLAEIGARMPVIVDSRENAALYTGVILKPNEVEAALAVGRAPSGAPAPEEYGEIAKTLSARTGRPVIVTLGEVGALWYSGDEGLAFAPTRPQKPPVDIVGAGDTFLSAFCAARAAGAAGGEALAFANLASGVTVKKIGTTGTASPAEIIQKFEENSR